MFRSTASVAGQAPLTASVAGQAPLTASVAGQAPLIFALALAGCLSEEPQGIAKAQTALTTVVMDFEHRPLPEIPLPNDIATRHDSTSATGRRINASLVAPTGLEGEVRELIDQLDGWGLLMPISIPFSGPLDIQSILDGQRGPELMIQLDAAFHAYNNPIYGSDHLVLTLSFDAICDCSFPWNGIERVFFSPAPVSDIEGDDEDEPETPHLRLVT